MKNAKIINAKTIVETVTIAVGNEDNDGLYALAISDDGTTYQLTAKAWKKYLAGRVGEWVVKTEQSECEDTPPLLYSHMDEVGTFTSSLIYHEIDNSSGDWKVFESYPSDRRKMRHNLLLWE